MTEKAAVFPIHDFSAVDMAFGGGSQLREFMPKYEDIPKEFKDWNGRNKWNKLFADWFYCGLNSLELTPKEGIDKDKALRHIRTIMGSFEPKHEHKEAAVAYLFSQWFEDAKWEAKKMKLP